MAKEKWANLIFKTGEMRQVPVKGEIWPDVIEHTHATPEAEVVLRFTRIGVQHGLGAYIETPREGAV